MVRLSKRNTAHQLATHDTSPVVDHLSGAGEGTDPHIQSSVPQYEFRYSLLAALIHSMNLGLYRT